MFSARSCNPSLSELPIAAICALSPSSDHSFLAYPSPLPSPSAPLSTTSPPAPPQSQSGDVLIFSTRTKTVANVIQAHKSPISLLSINAAGTMLATASDKGTVIRVWSIPGAEKLYQLRRGTREARIHSISFNAVSTLLAVSSAHDTVHIFKLGTQGRGSSSRSSTANDNVSPSGSVDSRGGDGQGLEGGFEAYIDNKKKGGVRYVTIPAHTRSFGVNRFSLATSLPSSFLVRRSGEGPHT